MTSTNYKLFNKISQSKLFNLKYQSRIFKTSKQSLTTITNSKHSKFLSTICNNNYSFTNNTNNLYLQIPNKYQFSTSISCDDNDDSDDSDDSDLSDFSDFSDTDSDDSDLEEMSSKKVQSAPTTANKNFTFGHDDVSEDVLMKDRLIISNLNFSTNRNDLWELCENYGTVTDVHLPANRNRDFHNRGFGFVTFESDKDAQKALDNIAGIMFNSRQLRAGFARKDTERPVNAPNPTPIRNDSRKYADFEFTNTTSTATTQQFQSNVQQQMGTSQISEGLHETTITVNGLPGNVNLAQITKMFGEFGNITNITFSPYRMMGHSFMNAIVSVDLKKNVMVANQGGADSVKVDRQVSDGKDFSFQVPDERDIKDRSIDKEEMRTMRRNPMGGQSAQQRQQQNQIRQGGVDPDILAKEIDELLADTDDEEGDTDSDSDTSSDDSSDEDEGDGEEDETEEDSDSDDDEAGDNKKGL